MLSNYLKIAIRSLRKHPAFAAINIAGLAVGMTCFILIMLYVQDERHYDSFHENMDRIVRVTSHYSEETGIRSFARSNPAVGPTLLKDIADVENTVRLQKYQGPLQYKDNVFNEDLMFFAEASLFKIFTFPIVRGDTETALGVPNTAVLTESAAVRFFGDEDPLGKVVVFSDTLEFTVSAIAQDVPEQSHLRFEVLLSFDTYKNLRAASGVDLDNHWRSGTFYTYAMLSSADAVDDVDGQLSTLVQKYVGDQSGTSSIYSLGLQPLKDIHLRSNLRQELSPNGSLSNVYIFSAIALFILLISCINFMNLATARSMRRAREVGVRKALGALRWQLIRQFLSEAILISFMALVLVALFVFFVLPFFNELSDRSVELVWAKHWGYIPAAIGLALVVGLLAGCYPAFLLSAFRPEQVLKGVSGSGRRSTTATLRRGLVVVQFTLSIAIIAGTVIALQQVQHMRDQNLGFDKDQIAVIPFYWESLVQENFDTIKNELLQHSSVHYVTASGDVPGRMFTSMSYWIEGMAESESRGINALIVEPDFAETYGLQVVSGRDFSPEMTSDLGASFILNEAAVKEIGLTKDEVVGKRFRMNTTGPVVGVVKDFHFEGLQNNLEPLVMTVWPDWFGYISVRLETENLAETVAYVEDTWESTIPNRPFELFFLNDDFEKVYQAEKRFGQVFMVFAVLAIFISCLGLFGLAAFTAEQRTKEIGLRKVLGASVSNLVILLNRDMTLLVVLSAVLATPIAYLFMAKWLNGFAYHIDISISTFIVAGLVALGVMWATVAFQSVKTALGNPINALRHQ